MEHDTHNRVNPTSTESLISIIGAFPAGWIGHMVNRSLDFDFEKATGGLNERRNPKNVGGVSYAGITQQAYAWMAGNDNQPLLGAYLNRVRRTPWEHRPRQLFTEAFYDTIRLLDRYHVLGNCLNACRAYFERDFVVNAGSLRQSRLFRRLCWLLR